MEMVQSMERHRIKKNERIYSFIFFSILFGIASGMLQFVIPLYALNMHAEKPVIGLIRGVAQIGGLLSTLPAGFLTDRFGYRRMLVGSGLLNATLFLFILNTSTLQQFTVFLLVEGLIRSLGWTALNSEFISQLKYFGFNKSGWARASLGIGMSFVGPLLGGQMVNLLSYRAVFMIIGLITLLPSLLLFFVKLGDEKDVQSYSLSEPSQTVRRQLRLLLVNKPLIRVALIQSIAIACSTAFTVFVVVFLADDLKCSPGWASWIVSIHGAGMVACMFWSGRLVDCFNPGFLYFLGFGMQIIGLCTATFNLGLGLIGLGAMIFGVGTGLISNLSYTQLGRIKGEKGKMSGLFYLITGSGIMLGPVYSGVMASWFGISAAFYSYIPIIIGMVVLVWEGEIVKDPAEDVSIENTGVKVG